MLEFGPDVKSSYVEILKMAFLGSVCDEIKKCIVQMAADSREAPEDP